METNEGAVDQIREHQEQRDCVEGTQVTGFVSTLGELVQLVKFWVQESLDMYWDAFLHGGSFSQVEEEAIWTRLDKIRQAIGRDEFLRAVELACTQFGLEVDARLWEIFLHSDEALRRAVALEMTLERETEEAVGSENLTARIQQMASMQRTEIPREVSRRLVR